MTELNTGGGEQVEIETEDASENTQEMTMFIDKVSPNDEGTQTTGFTMEIVSKEVLSQRQASIRKRYDGKISDSVNSILTDPLPNGLGTDKPININPDTVNEYSFWGNGRTPFYWCVTLDLRKELVLILVSLQDICSLKTKRDLILLLLTPCLKEKTM